MHACRVRRGGSCAGAADVRRPAPGQTLTILRPENTALRESVHRKNTSSAERPDHRRSIGRTLRPTDRRKLHRQRPLSASRANRPSPALIETTPSSPCSTGKNGAGTPGAAAPRAPAPSSKHRSDAVTSSRNFCSKSSTSSSSFWNWSSLPRPSWKNSSS